jgi:hypothetical protein
MIDRRRAIIIVASAIAAVLVVFLVVSLVSSRRPQRTVERSDEYFDRTLMIRELEYRLPDVEERMIDDRLYPVVDPERPFPEDLADEIRMDELRALHDTLTSELEDEIERMIFDEEE